MSTQTFRLDQLGWSAIYSQQLSLEDLAGGFPARVSSAHRNGLTVLSEHGTSEVTLPPRLTGDAPPLPITVGDWVMIERDAPRASRLLERRSLIARMAAGTAQRLQPIAANLDTLFVVTSCNQDFNPARLERYLAVAYDAGVEPVIVLTKADLCHDVDAYSSVARGVAAAASVLAVDATSNDLAQRLAGWLTRGQTVAFVGSSGVGKSTLVNTLTASASQATAGIREDDSRGRHTTTSRQMFALPCGAWVIDTPGMRELKVGAVESGVSAVFADVEQLAAQCRFRDCNHEKTAGCAVAPAIADGRLDPRRFSSYLKLRREAARAARTTHERHEIDRQFGRIYRAAQRQRRKQRGNL